MTENSIRNLAIAANDVQAFARSCSPGKEVTFCTPYGSINLVGAIFGNRQERDRLVHLHSLRFEHLEQTTFGLGIVAIYKSEAFRRSAVLGHTLTYDHLEPSFGSRLLVFCMDITAVDSNDKRCGRIRKPIPVSLAATNEHVLLFTQFVF